MKKLIYKFIAFSGVVILVIVSYFTQPSAEMNKSSSVVSFTISDTQFIICAMDCRWDSTYLYIPQLKLNAWHKYTTPLQGWRGIFFDKYVYDISQYRDSVRNYITANRNNNMRTVMNRPKIDYYAYGQSSVYQCEPQEYADQDYWFYSYYNHRTGTPTLDSGNYVMHCIQGTHSAGYVVDSLIANREQANKLWEYFQSDYFYPWYVKPRIRIPTGISDNTPVCKIEVLNWDGRIIIDTTIKSDYFHKFGESYNGNYLEEFYFNLDQQSSIQIFSDSICPGQPREFTNWSNTNFKTDFRVYWLGQCDMWLDYVKVENLPAYQLFSGLKDNEIKDEVNQLALYGSGSSGYVPNQFYQEEFEFNTLPCKKYINNIIKTEAAAQGVDLSLMLNLNTDLFKVHIPNPFERRLSTAQYKKYLIDTVGAKVLVVSGYPLDGNDMSFFDTSKTSRHPTSLYSGGYNESIGILSYPLSVSAYDYWLQNKLDYGRGWYQSFLEILKDMDALSKNAADLRIFLLHQAFMSWGGGLNLKEPTNEEMNVMKNLAISYGLKGIMYFAYMGFGDYPNSYTRGLADPPNNCQPRYFNAYNQAKWDTIISMNIEMEKWGPNIMKFTSEKTHSYIYRSEKNLMTGNAFIQGVKTYNPAVGVSDTSTNIINLTYQPPESTYIQAAVFDVVSPETYVKYMMIVNRRCSPCLDNTTSNRIGGRRIVTLNLSGLPSFNNWKLINLETNALVKTFDKNDTEVNLGNFQPGEGKLYKLVSA